MALLSWVRSTLAAAHITLCLRWPTLVAIAAVRAFGRKPRGSVRSILVVRPDGLGDCVLTLPVIESLRRCFPGARMTVLTTPMAAPLFSAHPAVNGVMVLRLPLPERWPKYLRGMFGSLRLFSQLRAQRFDVALLPRWDADIYHGTLLCALSGAPIRIGYADDVTAYKLRICRGFERAWTTVLPGGAPRHEALHALDTATPLGCNPGAIQLRLLLEMTVRDDARGWLHAALGNVGAHVLVGVGLPAAEAKKRWPAALYRDALLSIRKHDVAFVLFADGATAEDARLLHGALPASCIAQELPLMLTAGILSVCAVFVGSDSGLGHLATAVGCPTVTLFAQAASCDCHTGWHSNSPVRFRPLGARGIVLQAADARSGCEDGCCQTVPHCILDIRPQQVAEAVNSLLADPAAESISGLTQNAASLQ